MPIVLPTTVLFMLPVGAAMCAAGTLSMGTLALSVLLAMAMGGPLMRLVEFMPMLPQITHKAEKIEKLLREPEMEDGSIAVRPARHDIEFENVTFAYKDQDVLKGVSFAAKENTVTALVGESGAGKSTVAKLLVRFWDVKGGAIKVGGADIRDLRCEALMGMISYVSQDTFLFNTSILENIRMGRPDATDEQVMEAAKLAQCHEFIMQAEHGYKTLVGGSGDKLSGGQRQRIAIARALLLDAPIVVLDEATSFADPENEDNIQAALSGLIRGKTLIVIAHRLSTIMDADNIVVLDKGEIAAQGKHDALLSNSPIYRRLWDAHASTRDWDIRVSDQEGSVALHA